MNTLLKSAFAAVLALTFSMLTVAQSDPDTLLNQIDADIAAKRLSAPSGNNAMEKIFLFKSTAPYDQRITSRVNQVGEFYVELANKAIAKKQYNKAQSYLDKSWMLSYLTPGLDDAQNQLDEFLVSQGKQTAVAATKKKPAPKPVAKKKEVKVVKKVAQAKPKPAIQKATKPVEKKVDKAAQAKALAAKRAAEEKRRKQLAAKKAAQEKARQAKLAEERRLADQRREAEKKAQAAAKLAKLQAQRERALTMRNKHESTPSLANFDLDQTLIDDRATRDIREALGPICQEILDNEASVVLHTKTPQDYRWLTVRLTLCVRRLDKSFRLRHSNKLADSEPSISLHPGRNISLLKKSRN